MAYSTQQLATLLSHALPATQLRAAHMLTNEHYVLEIDTGERLDAQFYASSAEAYTAQAALQQLHGEIDLPIPQLRASDPNGAVLGQPYLLTAALKGEPLEHALPRINDEQQYKLGRKLGEILYRVHRLACTHYGDLCATTSNAAPSDERSYLLERVQRALQACGTLGLIDRQVSAQICAWFERVVLPSSRRPALVHGALNPQCILVHENKTGWSISGIRAWEHALGWNPAWEHITLLDALAGMRLFSIRVGYGNGYDEQTNQTYEQVREHALTPYRVLLTLQHMQTAIERNNIAELDQQRNILRGLMAFFDK